MAYLPAMEFEWDEGKSDACLAQRGFDLAYALRAFLDPNRLIRKDSRWDYGEDRHLIARRHRGSDILRGLYRPERGHSDHFGAQGEPTRGTRL